MNSSGVVALCMFAFMMLTLAFTAGAQETTGAGFTPHVLYCDTAVEAITLVEHLMAEENHKARLMLVPQASSCHDTIKEQRPPMYARGHEEVFSRYALGHTFVVESAITPSGRVVYVMGAHLGE